MNSPVEEKIPHDSRLPYETPSVVVQGSFESLTQQDVDGARFDMSFNAGDPIPEAFAS